LNFRPSQRCARFSHKTTESGKGGPVRFGYSGEKAPLKIKKTVFLFTSNSKRQSFSTKKRDKKDKKKTKRRQKEDKKKTKR
jgi:hypothetical protein